MDVQNKHKFAILIILAITGLIFMQQIQPEKQTAIVVQGNASETAEDSISQPENTSNEIVVHVAGAVENPGVYVLQEGQRVEDALQKAGISDHADENALNRAALLTDGQKIVVPFADETHIINQQDDTETNGIDQTSQNVKINLNQANMLQLMELPGIGEVKANAIIQYRQEHGSFQSTEELLMVNGIGNTIYSQIAELVCV